MDGVHVKIAEAYKPPRKICLPAAYNNKLPDVSKLTYDFNLERSVLEKVEYYFTSVHDIHLFENDLHFMMHVRFSFNIHDY